MFRAAVFKSSALMAPRNQVRLIRMSRRTKPLVITDLNNVIYLYPAQQRKTDIKTINLGSKGPSTLDKYKQMYCQVINSNEYDIAREYSIKAKEIAVPVIEQIWCQCSKYAKMYLLKLYEKLYPIILRNYVQLIDIAAGQIQRFGNRLYAFLLSLHMRVMCTWSNIMDKAQKKIKDEKKY